MVCGSLKAHAMVIRMGFRLTARQSAVDQAVALGILRIPGWLLATVLRSLGDGYTIASFESDG
jgi:hypothetical protein